MTLPRTPSSRPRASSTLFHRHLPLVMAVISLAVIVGAEVMAPEPLELPMISFLTLGLAAAVALVAWACGARRDGPNVTAWDLAGAFTLIGCAAAMLTQNEHALEYLLSTKNK